MKSIALPEQVFEQSHGVSGETGLVRAGLDVPAQTALGGNILHVADGQPHPAGLYAGGKRLVRGAPAHPCQDKAAAEDPRVPGAKFVVHESPIVADSHQKSLSRSRALELLP